MRSAGTNTPLVPVGLWSKLDKVSVEVLGGPTSPSIPSKPSTLD